MVVIVLSYVWWIHLMTSCAYSDTILPLVMSQTDFVITSGSVHPDAWWIHWCGHVYLWCHKRIDLEMLVMPNYSCTIVAMPSLGGKKWATCEHMLFTGQVQWQCNKTATACFSLIGFWVILARRKRPCTLKISLRCIMAVIQYYHLSSLSCVLYSWSKDMWYPVLFMRGYSLKVKPMKWGGCILQWNAPWVVWMYNAMSMQM